MAAVALARGVEKPSSFDGGSQQAWRDGKDAVTISQAMDDVLEWLGLDDAIDDVSGYIGLIVQEGNRIFDRATYTNGEGEDDGQCKQQQKPRRWR